MRDVPALLRLRETPGDPIGQAEGVLDGGPTRDHQGVGPLQSESLRTSSYSASVAGRWASRWRSSPSN